MADYSKIYLFRITHIENIPHILKNGITHANSPNCNPNYKAIGDSSLIDRRKEFYTPCAKSLGEYIPFYFGTRMPMLYLIQNGFNGVKQTNAEEIVYCISSVEQIIKHLIPFYFTDGHAVDNLSEFYTEEYIDRIDELIDTKAINSKYWKDENDLDLKRRKEAEFLIEKDLPSDAVLGYAVLNERAKNKLLSLGIKEEKVIIRPKYYF